MRVGGKEVIVGVDEDDGEDEDEDATLAEDGDEDAALAEVKAGPKSEIEVG